MDLIGETVKHKSFGRGTVTECDKSYLTVQFEQAEKKFQYPDAFKSFLVIEDKTIMNELKTLIKVKKRDYLLIAPEKIYNLVEEPQKTHEAPSKPAPVKKSKNKRHNIAFKCNYCDGGAADSSVGYHGVCSDDIIQNNIKIEKRVWCSAEDSECRRYLAGEITRSELDAMCSGNDAGFVCHESQMLRDWKAFAGITQSGENKGQPVKLKEVKNDSLAVLTTRRPDSSEEERFVFAVFLVEGNYGGGLKEKAYVTTSSEYKMELAPAEASKILYWNYYFNINKPDLISLGSGMHRYLSDEQAAQILKDIVDVKTDIDEKKLAVSFFEHFCLTKGIDKNDIAPPSGTLARQQ